MQHSARKHAITPVRARRASRGVRSRALQSAAASGGCIAQELTCDEGAVNQVGRFRVVRLICNRVSYLLLVGVPILGRYACRDTPRGSRGTRQPLHAPNLPRSQGAFVRRCARAPAAVCLVRNWSAPNSASGLFTLTMHPGGVPSLGATLRLLHKQRRADIIAHLRSLDHDARFVTSAHAALGEPPTFANLRCGVWHVPPTVASSGHCYFKSTDGHAGQWGFSLTRLNMQVAIAAVMCAGGVIIVDSTRSGKRYPDSLSKTVPIWCCVLNRAVAAARSVSSWDTALLLPPWVPPSEAAQIEERLAGWVEMLRRPALAPVLSRLAEVLDRPLRPSWLCPLVEAEASYAARASAVQEAASARGAPFAWVHCVCASEVCTAEEARARASYTYIQGAGDDDENWARGLTAVQWWRWRDELIPLAARDHEAAERRLAERKAWSGHLEISPKSERSEKEPNHFVAARCSRWCT